MKLPVAGVLEWENPKVPIFQIDFPSFFQGISQKNIIMFPGKFPSFLQLFHKISQNMPKFILSPHQFLKFPLLSPEICPFSPLFPRFWSQAPRRQHHAPHRPLQGHGQPQRGVGQEVVPRPRNACGTGAPAATRGRSEGHGGTPGTPGTPGMGRAQL